jgi:spore germination protein GerM
MRRGLVVVAVVAAVLAGCGLPDDSRPRIVDQADAPLELEPTTSTPVVETDTGDETVAVYFMSLDQTHLESLRRPVEEVTPAAAINALLQMGLAEAERATLVNLIPPGVVLRGSEIDDAGVLTLDLGPAGEGGIQSVQADGQRQAFAQLVFTATAVPASGVTGVRFLVEGQPIDVLTDAGAVGEPVSRDDYARLSPVAG